MSMSPSDIIERMDKLKKWQKEQEQLMLQHHQSLQENNLFNDDSDCSYNKLENKIGTPHIFDSETKNKKPFLRRGSGLSRFKMAPGEQFKNLNRRKSITPNTNIILSAPNQRTESKGNWSNASGSQEINASLLLFEELEKKLKDSSIYIGSETSTKRELFKNDAACWIAHTPELKLPSEKILTGEELYEDITQKNEKIMKENKRQMIEIEQYEKYLQEELLSSLEQAIQFKALLKQDVAVDSTVNTSPTSTNTGTIKDFDDLEKWGSNISVHSTTSTISSSEVLHNVPRFDIATMTDELAVTESQSETTDQLQERLKDELKLAQIEHKEVKIIKKQLEQQRCELEKLRKGVLKHAEEEKENYARSHDILDEERKKFAKEKMVFERYIKERQNKPNKKEREEITVLKEELATLKETYKLKEVKNSTSQARLRNQIKSLEKENAELKLEIEKLTKDNGRLIATQRLSKKPTDTKLLHEINKNITKLAQEQLSKITEKLRTDTNSPSSEKENFRKSPNSNVDSRIKPNKDGVTNEGRKSDGNYEEVCYVNHETVKSPKNDERNISNRIEEILPDGSKIVNYSNGNVKTVSSDGNTVEFKYFNGDVKTTNLLEGTISYYYVESKVCHTTKADGTEILVYPDGQLETRLTDGTSEIKYPNGIIVQLNDQGEKVLIFTNGQKEIHTKDHKRREYPDGTIKLLYPDGRQETRYSNGRIRIKDKDGALLFDSVR